MTDAFKQEAVIRILFLMVGIFLMLYGGVNLNYAWLVVVGALIMLLVPTKFYRNFENRIYENPKTNAGTWRPVSQSQLYELIQLIEPKDSMHVGGSKGYSTTGIGLFLVFFLCFWISGMFSSVMIEFGLPVTLPAVLILIFYAWFRLRGNWSIVPHPLSIQMTTIQILNELSLPTQFSKKFEAQIVNDVNGDPDILNIRLDVRPKDPISGLLCLRLTMDRTEVKGSTYCFPYLVLVFGGTGVFYSERINKAIDFSVPHPFRIDKSLSDGNSVFVVLPARRLYTLDEAGTAELAEILCRLCDVCENNRKEIEAISVMPKQM